MHFRIPTISLMLACSSAICAISSASAFKSTCVISPNCHARNRQDCIEGKASCGPCFAGFVAPLEWSNTPCEATPDDAAAAMEAVGQSNNTYVPIVDLYAFRAAAGEDEAQARVEAAKVMLHAITGPGFLYVRNPDLNWDVVEHMFNASADFFARDVEEKSRFAWSDPAENSGYVRVGHESLDEDDKDSGDPKESYDMNKNHMLMSPVWGESVAVDFWRAVDQLKVQVLKAIAVALGMDDSDTEWMTQSHSEEWNTLRLLHYPATEGQPKQMRAGPHTDYGTMTLLFQDPSGGLEVFHREFGIWTAVTPIPNTVVVNIADLFMRWSNDRLVSTLHRVVATKSNNKSDRYSIAHFVNPNANFLVDPLDMDTRIKASQMSSGTVAGEGRHYDPIKTHEYLEERLSATFLDSEKEDGEQEEEKTEL